jgi:hypothetical protein
MPTGPPPTITIDAATIFRSSSSRDLFERRALRSDAKPQDEAHTENARNQEHAEHAGGAERAREERAHSRRPVTLASSDTARPDDVPQARIRVE